MRMLGDHPTLYLVVRNEWPTKKPDFPGFSELFSVSRYSYPRPFRRPKNKRYRLRLLFLLDLQSSPTVLPSVLAHHVDPNSSPPKYISIHLGGDAGSCTQVHSAFTWKELQQFLYYIFNPVLGQPGPSYHQF